MGKRGPLAKNKLPVAVKIVGSNPAMPTENESKEHEARERKWKAEEGLRTLQRVDEIKRDKQLMNDIQKLAKEQMAALSKVAK